MSPYSITPEQVARALSSQTDAELRERLGRAVVMLAHAGELIRTLGQRTPEGYARNAVQLSIHNIELFVRECSEDFRQDTADVLQIPLLTCEHGGARASVIAAFPCPEKDELRPPHAGMAL